MIRLRHLAEINPPTPEFDLIGDVEAVTFLPLEAVWEDSRLDVSRARPKREVVSGYVRFREQDVVCPKVTPTFQAGRSAVMVGLRHQVGAGTTELHVLRARPTLSEPRFLQYTCLTRQFLDEGVAHFQGVAGLQRVPAEFIKDFTVTDVGVAQQVRIADFLDDQVTRIEEAVDLRQRSITLLRHRANAELVATAFPTDVSTFPITYVADFLMGRQRSPENEMGAYMTPYVRSANVKDGVVEMDNLNLMNFTPAEQNTYRLLRGDVLVTEASGSPEAIGAAGVWMGDKLNTVCFQNHLIRVRPKSGRACWEFLALWARASHRSGSFRSWATGAQILNLGFDSLKRAPVAQLTLEEQIDIARLWNDRESLWLSLDATGVNQVRLLRERKRALITACITGEFDVSSASTRAADAVIR